MQQQQNAKKCGKIHPLEYKTVYDFLCVHVCMCVSPSMEYFLNSVGKPSELWHDGKHTLAS